MTALPPRARSRAAAALDRFAALGELRLQRCRGCGRVLWPPRDACPACLSGDLAWAPVAAGGRLLAATEVAASAEPWFAARLPWPVGTVGMDEGPVVIAHRAPGLARGARVRLALRLDRTGRAALVAGPEEGEAWTVPDFSDDPRGRRVRLIACPEPVAAALAAALAGAGARLVPDGAAEGTAEGSVDILVAGAGAPRPGLLLGGALAGGADVRALGADLAAALGAMQSAAAGLGAGGVWVSLIGIDAFAPFPEAPAEGVRAAALLAATRALRAETRVRGLRVAALFHGRISGPGGGGGSGGLAPAELAAELLALLRRGGEEAWAGAEAARARARIEADPLGHPWTAAEEQA